MHRPVQWKFAAKAAHGPRGEQGRAPSLLDLIQSSKIFKMHKFMKCSIVKMEFLTNHIYDKERMKWLFVLLPILLPMFRNM